MTTTQSLVWNSGPEVLFHAPEDRKLVLNREFVVNIISHWMLEAANITCGDFAHNESEWEAANLTPIPSLKVSMS